MKSCIMAGTEIMNAKKRRRLYFAAALVAAGGVLAAAIVYELGNNVLYFYSPSDVAAKHVEPGVAFRIGGLVEKASLRHGAGADVRFVVTDGARALPVDFNGVLPALFREGQGVVATGRAGRQRHLQCHRSAGQA